MPFGSTFVKRLKPFVVKISLVTRDQLAGTFGIRKELVLNSGTKFEAVTGHETVATLRLGRFQNNRGNGFVCTVMLAELFEMNGSATTEETAALIVATLDEATASKVNVVVALLCNVPNAQTNPEAWRKTVPWATTGEAMETDGGIVTVSRTFVASVGPAFWTL